MPAAVGPAARDLNTVAHLYGSTVAPYGDANAGLVGVLMVTAKGALKSTGQARHRSSAFPCFKPGRCHDTLADAPQIVRCKAAKHNVGPHAWLICQQCAQSTQLM